MERDRDRRFGWFKGPLVTGFLNNIDVFNIVMVLLSLAGLIRLAQFAWTAFFS